MKILFLHGWHSVPGGVKPTYLKDHGHEVINPALDDGDFDAALATAQAEFDKLQPQVVVGSSRGGAVAMNINSGDAKLVLLCPAWKNWGPDAGAGSSSYRATDMHSKNPVTRLSGRSLIVPCDRQLRHIRQPHPTDPAWEVRHGQKTERHEHGR